MNHLVFVILIGIGATALMDLWSLLRKNLLNISQTNWGMVGRWIAYLPQGQFTHNTIAESHPIRGEHLIGWVAHYLIGIGYAGLLILTGGEAWVNNPTVSLALVIGIVTVVAPFFILQPGMGAGIAASNTNHPNSARLHSVINHTVFGFGLFLSAEIIKLIHSA